MRYMSRAGYKNKKIQIKEMIVRIDIFTLKSMLIIHKNYWFELNNAGCHIT